MAEEWLMWYVGGDGAAVQGGEDGSSLAVDEALSASRNDQRADPRRAGLTGCAPVTMP